MPASYEKIDYSLRPAKAIERKMLGELFSRLNIFAPINNYRYVGLGSIYFSDFILFHRLLGFKTMISIENEIENQKRFKLNLPFRFIELKFGDALSILPTLKWNTQSIVWLDFDTSLNLDMLLCIEYLIKNLSSGSILLISCNGSLKGRATDFDDRKAILDEQLEGKLTEEIKKPNQIEGWSLAKLYRTIINEEINSSIVDRNRGLKKEDKIKYEQLINIHYQENSRSARMLTVGGVIFKSKDSKKFNDCNFNNLNFVSNDNTPYDIKIPILTYKELKYLDSKMPIKKQLNNHDIPISQINLYEKHYRYFPNYKDIEA
ncbi:hypothetical protein PQ456_04390 [Paenibacillus kyungheensis]|uniref:Three-Cys-motif partner protein n=1 Tax=Paenibacillus kyungheensis TaxID=1452732 RepID=A0AAX3M3D1_9BACL|nr:O-methyltransferase [Paenibacillus kyungheensis]WCT56769.1 hypothetical protein PQ456_04390 [Paenibacillus kyungheensis]